MTVSKFDQGASAVAIHLIRRMLNMSLSAFLFCGVVALLIGVVLLILTAVSRESDSFTAGQTASSIGAMTARYDSASKQWVLDGSRVAIAIMGAGTFVVGVAIMLLRRFLQKYLRTTYFDKSNPTPEQLKITRIKAGKNR